MKNPPDTKTIQKEEEMLMATQEMGIGAPIRKKPERLLEIEMKKLKAFLVAVIPEHHDVYDLVAKFDSSLTYLENKEAIIEDLKLLYPTEFKGGTLKEQAEQAKAVQEGLNADRDAKIAKEIAEYNAGLCFVDCKELDAYYVNIHRAVEKIAQGYSNLAFIKGRGGTGKSWNIKKILVKCNSKFVEIAGDITEAYLYRLLFEHNGEVIWIRDVAKLLKGSTCLPFYTKVMTNNGCKLIKDLKPDTDKVASWNFSKHIMEYKNFEKYATGMKQVVRIKTTEGIVESSPEHKWIVKDKNGKIREKKAKDLNIKDVLLSLK